MRDSGNTSNKPRIRTLTVDTDPDAGPFSVGDYAETGGIAKPGIRAGDTVTCTAMGLVANGVYTPFAAWEPHSRYWQGHAVVIAEGVFDLVVVRAAGNVAPIAMPGIRWRVTFIRP
jgi:hypothetical protein